MKKIVVEIPVPDLRAIVSEAQALGRSLLALAYLFRAIRRIDSGNGAGALDDLVTALRISPEMDRKSRERV